jgi:hypothetical protein
MTWTVFQHQAGPNATEDHAPGRGGYTYVLVPLRRSHAIDWFESTYGENPTRMVPWPEFGPDSQVWTDDEYDDPADARRACGQLELDQGGIGSPMMRDYTWAELYQRFDVKVVTADEV